MHFRSERDASLEAAIDGHGGLGALLLGAQARWSRPDQKSDGTQSANVVCDTVCIRVAPELFWYMSPESGSNFRTRGEDVAMARASS